MDFKKPIGCLDSNVSSMLEDIMPKGPRGNAVSTAAMYPANMDQVNRTNGNYINQDQIHQGQKARVEGMGFDRDLATESLLATNGSGVDQAASWLLAPGQELCEQRQRYL
jgi:hypothetical protein